MDLLGAEASQMMATAVKQLCSIDKELTLDLVRDLP